MALRPVRSGLSTLLLVLCGLLIFAATAHAKKLVVVEAGLRGQTHAATESTALRLGNLVSNGLGLQIQDASDALHRLRRTLTATPQHERTRRLEEISRDIQRGDELLYTDPEGAIPILDGARQELQQLMESRVPGEGVKEKLFQAQMLLARSHLDNGDEQSAGDVMEQIIQRFGERDDINTDNYHPALVDLYEKTARRMSRKKTGTLRVMAAEGAELEFLLNGMSMRAKGGDRALTPYTVEGLLPGEYRVQLRDREGDLSLVHLVSVGDKDGAQVTIDPDFDHALRLDAESFGLLFDDRQGYDHNVADYASRIGAATGADEVLVVGFMGDKKTPRLVSQRVDVRTRRAAAAVEMQVDEKGASDAQLFQATQVLCGFAVAGPDVPVDPTPIPEPPAGRSGSAPWYTDWIGWTLVGVGVVSVGVAGYFTADTLDKVDCATDPYCGDYDHRWSQAQSAKDGRVIYGTLYGIGGAAIVGGILVFALRDRGPASTAEADHALPLIAPFTAPEGNGLSFQTRF